MGPFVSATPPIGSRSPARASVVSWARLSADGVTESHPARAPAARPRTTSLPTAAWHRAPPPPPLFSLLPHHALFSRVVWSVQLCWVSVKYCHVRGPPICSIRMMYMDWRGKRTYHVYQFSPAGVHRFKSSRLSDMSNCLFVIVST
jgi:hypothetical protein